MKILTSLSVALIFATSAWAQASSPSAFDKPTLERYLRHMEGLIPQVALDISDPKPAASLPGFMEVAVTLSFNGQSKQDRYYVSQDGKNVIKGEIFAIDQSPFQGNLDRLRTEGEPAYGTPGAKVQIAVFGDFQCPYCKAEADVLRTNLVQTFGEEVQVVFKDFPLESIHPWARAASIAGRCVFNQDGRAFWSFHDWIYSEQEQITETDLNEKVLGWAGQNGVDTVQLGRCIETKESEPAVQANIDEGRALGVDSTPTMFINGRKLAGAMQWPGLEQLIKMEIEHETSPLASAATPASPASDDCCAVNIPTVGGR